MKKFILFFFILMISLYFIYSPNPIGTYVAKNNINSIDSIFVLSDGSYIRVIYLKSSGKLLFRNTGQWKYNNERIIFDNFYPNDDENLFEGSDFESVLLTFSVPLEKSFGRIVFDYNEETAKYKFQKKYF